jgi:hypothetical protein
MLTRLLDVPTKTDRLPFNLQTNQVLNMQSTLLSEQYMSLSFKQKLQPTASTCLLGASNHGIFLLLLCDSWDGPMDQPSANCLLVVAQVHCCQHGDLPNVIIDAASE